MRIKTLYLKNFRNYKEAIISLAPDLNFFQGHNAQGKTSLLEAISILSIGRSFRTEKLSELIMDGETFFHLEVLFEKGGVDQRIKILFDRQNKSVIHNGQSYSQFSSLFGILPAVISSSSDVQIIIGPPEIRRRLLNLHIAQFDPLYVYHISRFNRALKQRNAMLKTQQIRGIDVFEYEMAVSSEYMIKKRLEALAALSHFANPILQTLTKEREMLSLTYLPSTPSLYTSKEEFILYLEKTRAKDLQYKYTLSGPHRDDFEILLNQKVAKTYASEGQRQSIIAALKLAEKENLKNLHKVDPLFGMDDFTNHLDLERQELLKTHLSGKSQTFLTTPLLTPQGENALWICEGQIYTEAEAYPL